MYAQQVAAQQAILAAARASGASFVGKGMAGGVPGVGLPPRMSNQSSVDSEREDDEDRGRDSGDDDEDNEMMEGDEGSDDDEGSASGLEFLRKQTLALQQSASRIPARPFVSYSASAPQRAASPPIRVKQEPDEGMSPAGPNSATSPNGQADWGFDDHFRQVRTHTLLLLNLYFLSYSLLCVQARSICNICVHRSYQLGFTNTFYYLCFKLYQTMLICIIKIFDLF